MLALFINVLPSSDTEKARDGSGEFPEGLEGRENADTEHAPKKSAHTPCHNMLSSTHRQGDSRRSQGRHLYICIVRRKTLYSGGDPEGQFQCENGSTWARLPLVIYSFTRGLPRWTNAAIARHCQRNLASCERQGRIHHCSN